MKYITLTASEMVDGKKIQLGSQENFPIAETMEDLLEMETLDCGCNQAEVVACFNAGWKVKSQVKLRAVADPTKPTSVFKKISEAKQNEILELARKQGLL